ncbi:FAD-binding oxidoreductase [Oceanimonas sp. MB9]|uniref:NAD(P)/FAD-dependent oxidoreductase n=1 Tax=Oceanimonas sp. MB9 TaxID=2588453 RepID=UPI0013F59AF9|nr:FAD-binding oxidoreductase [Oceanimonas sp. MB9]NHI00413.1 Hydrogen cyanide synthase subunit HcnC [Oceanimonas sp. MB9]
MQEVIVIGAGVVGSAVAYGLARQGLSVTLLDEGDRALRASRGNFGLVWCQGKGFGAPAYADITARSCREWPGFAEQLQAETGIDVEYDNRGGLYFYFDAAGRDARQQRLSAVQQQAAEALPFSLLDREQLLETLPDLGPEVLGASFCPLDGTCDPLKLLYALLSAARRQGVSHRTRCRANRILVGQDQRLEVETTAGTLKADKVVIAAGLDSDRLAGQVGLKVPLEPVRGQIMVSARQPERLALPSLQVRQTREGTIICGDSHEHVGEDCGTTVEVMQAIAQRAVRIYPFLADIQVNRAWGALRIMTPDGLPLYEQAPMHPGIFNVSCHSGITLAAFHANQLANCIADGQLPASLASFRGDRFDV